MSRYGIDYYGSSYYGSGTLVNFSVYPFTAKPYGYGGIKLNWVSPTGTWAKIRLIRNSYGYPVNAYDGQVLLTAYNGSDPAFFVDTSGLNQGAYYYYSLFTLETTQYTWVRAGNVQGVSVKEYKNSDNLYGWLPQIYKTSNPYTVSTNQDNADLYNFLSLFGFELDYYQTITSLLLQRFNTEKVNGALIPSMLDEFGIPYEPEVGLQQNRVILRDNIKLEQKKGTRAGLVDYIRDFSGYVVPSVPSATTFIQNANFLYESASTNYVIPSNPSVEGIVVGHNLMLNYNDSSFEESVGGWKSTNSSASLSNLTPASITKVQLTSNVATLTIGAHNYKVGNVVYIYNCSAPLFNSLSKTITAVTSTTISYALTNADVPLTTATGDVKPLPAGWSEPTAPILFPNKQKGILAVTNASASSGTVLLSCGEDEPIRGSIPVTAGLSYTFSVYAVAGTTGRAVTTKINWYDRFGAVLSTSTGSAVTDATGSFVSTKRPYVTGTAPANCWYAVPVISIASVAGSATNEYHYFDCAQFEQSSSVTDFDEARQVHITLRGQRINELVNPSFAGSFTPWTFTNASATQDTTLLSITDDSYSVKTTAITSNVATVELNTPHILKVGESIYISNISGTGVTAANYNGARTITSITLTTFSFAVTASNQTQKTTSGDVWSASEAAKVTASGTPVTIKSWNGSTTSQLMNIYYPNTDYSFSVYCKTSTGSENISLSIVWYDISHSVLSTSTGSTLSISSSSWSRPSVTATAPTTAAYASVSINWSSSSAGEIIYLDDALFENSSFILPYFDGSHGSAADLSELLWEGGIINGARSHYYKNRVAVETRLITNVIDNIVPMGTTISIYLAQPQT